MHDDLGNGWKTSFALIVENAITQMNSAYCILVSIVLQLKNKYCHFYCLLNFMYIESSMY